MQRSVTIFATFGLVCGLIAVGLFEWWLSSADLDYSWSTFAPTLPPHYTGAGYTDVVVTHTSRWWLDASLVAVPTAIGAVFGFAAGRLGWLNVRS